MEKIQNKNDLTDKIKTALDKAVKTIIAEEKAKGGHLVTGDKEGNIKNIPAKDL